MVLQCFCTALDTANMLEIQQSSFSSFRIFCIHFRVRHQFQRMDVFSRTWLLKLTCIFTTEVRKYFIANESYECFIIISLHSPSIEWIEIRIWFRIIVVIWNISGVDLCGYENDQFCPVHRPYTFIHKSSSTSSNFFFLMKICRQCGWCHTKTRSFVMFQIFE